MRVSDFYSGWSGDGFGELRDHEAHFADAHECDHIDDVALAFAERSRPIPVPMVGLERSACAICGTDLGHGASGFTCSRTCAHALGQTVEAFAPGMVFGLLTALHQVESTNLGALRWQFRCSCGSLVIRLVAHVRRAMRRGNPPACAACNNSSRGRNSLTADELLAAAERNHRAWARRARKA